MVCDGSWEITDLLGSLTFLAHTPKPGLYQSLSFQHHFQPSLGLHSHSASSPSALGTRWNSLKTKSAFSDNPQITSQAGKSLDPALWDLAVSVVLEVHWPHWFFGVFLTCFYQDPFPHPLHSLCLALLHLDDLLLLGYNWTPIFYFSFLPWPYRPPCALFSPKSLHRN